MPQIKRRLPGAIGQHFEGVSFKQLDDLEHSHPQPIPQDCPRRKLACGHRTLGPGERTAISALRRQRHIQKLHGLGPRALDELLIEIGTEFGITAFIDQKLERYAKLDPEALEAAGGDIFSPVPIHGVEP